MNDKRTKDIKTMLYKVIVSYNRIEYHLADLEQYIEECQNRKLMDNKSTVDAIFAGITDVSSSLRETIHNITLSIDCLNMVMNDVLQDVVEIKNQRSSVLIRKDGIYEGNSVPGRQDEESSADCEENKG